MIWAVEALKSGEMGTNQASHKFDVPATTLKDRLSGRVKHDSKPGPAPYLSFFFNTTPAAQPLDVSFFGPLVQHWSWVCHSYVSENPSWTSTMAVTSLTGAPRWRPLLDSLRSLLQELLLKGGDPSQKLYHGCDLSYSCYQGSDPSYNLYQGCDLSYWCYQEATSPSLPVLYQGYYPSYKSYWYGNPFWLFYCSCNPS